MTVNYVFAGIAVADYEAARAWYERLFGRPPDLVPNETEVAWQLTDTAWIYVVHDPERAAKALLTVLVDDLEAQVSELAARGMSTSPIETAPGLFRKAEIHDLEGNKITFAETLGDES